MKKSLIALAVAGVFAAPAVMADSNVTVYGVVSASMDMTNTGTGSAVGAPAGFKGSKISSNTSRLGVKGSEDLGGGASVVWQIESLVSIDGGANGAAAAPVNGLATRNTFVGLAAPTGTFLLGRHDTPYKIATRAYDLFGDGIADNRAIMGGGLNTVTAPATNGGVGTINLATGVRNAAGNSTGAGASFDGRQTDVLAYVSPKMGGFTAILAMVMGAEGQNNANQLAGSAYSLAGLYGNGPISASFAYETHNIGTAPGTVGFVGFVGLPLKLKESAWKIGAGYKVDAFEINAVYEKTRDDLGGALGAATVGQDLFGHSAYYLSGKVNFGASAVKLAYGVAGNLAMLGNAAAAADTGASQVSVGYDYGFSKRTTGYVLYTQLSNKANATYALGNAGIGNGNVFLNGAGSKPSAISMGIKHSF